MGYKIWLGPTLMLVGSIFLAVGRIFLLNQTNIYKNIKTGEYFQLKCSGEGIWLQPKKPILKKWFITIEDRDQIQVSVKRFRSDYIKVR